jgi:hypothetical protein
MTALIGPSGRQGATTLDEARREAILVYCKIAAASGALLSLKDLRDLLGVDATEDELSQSISSDASLAAKISVVSGHVLLKRPDSDPASALEATKEADKRRSRALANVEAARVFARLLNKDAVFVAVAGTNSYLSAAEGDDIDFYCITKTDGMWAFMLKSLLLSRASSVVRRGAPPFCFSFVMDEKKAREELSRPKGALYARDTLTAKVISGSGAYHSVLENASWMRSYFPIVYERRLREAEGVEGPHPHSKNGSKAMNVWLYLTLGSYVRLRAWVMNRKLARQGRSDAIFKAWIEPGRLEYASRRYVELGKMYQALAPNP